ncbi:hypothetical protein [Nocardia transvalensis]|uniref:hypothetical protein n=1 Tax=Nocardia transvalensis TaxID=37333 RepID=UPI001893E934|nr:hypothetical protein [Nocardia transvalensis]MBF6330357.1 hypothetical protein [Nocardia transvalensis]
MPTVTSANGRFFVVTECVTQAAAAAAAAAAGGTLAALTSATVDQLNFPADAFADIQRCDTPRSGPVAWFGSYNGGVPERTVYAVNLTTRRVFNVAAHRAAAWTGLVLAEARTEPTSCE